MYEDIRILQKGKIDRGYMNMKELPCRIPFGKEWGGRDPAKRSLAAGKDFSPT